MVGKKHNLLEFVPVKSQKIDYEIRENGLVQLIIKRDSLLDRIVRRIFNTPDKTIIDLDSIGSFVWESIDGKRNLHEISLLLKERFGKEVEPLNERLITYINILKNNKFIIFEKK